MSDAETSSYPSTIDVGHQHQPVLEADSDAVECTTAATLPLTGEDSILSGRGAIFGKSGAGKSNTANVIIEELLRTGRPLAIIDADGEYYGLKEEFELLHVGAGEDADAQVGPEHGAKLAELALEGGRPLILDVSGYLEDDTVRALLEAFTRRLFALAKEHKRPFPLFVEEAHEYLPESGLDDLGKMLVKIGKRGRKHGLGIVALSQRPADVKKDYVTQCDWVVWHRLTWQNDTRVVQRILGSDYATVVEALQDGEAFLAADWEPDVQRVQFRRQDTFDAGKRPTLKDETNRPDLKTVGEDILEELRAAGDHQRTLEDRVAHLEDELDEREATIAELREQLETREYVSEEVGAEFENLADRLGDAFEQAFAQSDAGALSDDVESTLIDGEDGPAVQVEVPDQLRADVLEVVREDLGEQVATLEEQRAELESKLADAEATIEDLRAEVAAKDDRLSELEATNEQLREQVADLEAVADRLEAVREVRDRLSAIIDDEPEDAAQYKQRARAEADRAETLEAVLRGEQPPEAAGLAPEEIAVAPAPAAGERDSTDSAESAAYADAEYVPLVEQQHEELTARVETAAESIKPGVEHIWTVLFLLAEVEDGIHEAFAPTPDERPTAEAVRERLALKNTSTVYELMDALASESVALVEKYDTGPNTAQTYGLATETFNRLDELAARRQRREGFLERVDGA